MDVPSYTVVVDYSRAPHIGARAEECKDVPKKGKYVVELELFQFHSWEETTTSETILAEMKKQSLRPATHEELQSFISNYKKLGVKSKILALGSVFTTFGFTIVIGAFTDYNGELEEGEVYALDENCSFLCVRKATLKPPTCTALVDYGIETSYIVNSRSFNRTKVALTPISTCKDVPVTGECEVGFELFNLSGDYQNESSILRNIEKYDLRAATDKELHGFIRECKKKSEHMNKILGLYSHAGSGYHDSNTVVALGSTFTKHGFLHVACTEVWLDMKGQIAGCEIDLELSGGGWHNHPFRSTLFLCVHK